MTIGQRHLHESKVDEWQRAFEKTVQAKDRPRLFANAIQSILFRSLKTLSKVTVTVVVDRVVSVTTEKFPLLAQVKHEFGNLDFTDLLQNSKLKPTEIEAALRELLIELLTVFGNITADILTAHLHKELMNVTEASLAKKNSEQK